MAKIKVEGGNGTYFVTVDDGKGQTKHRVQVKDGYAKSLTSNKASIEQLLIKSFEFLLAREPKETILPHFDLTAIKRFFPEYESEMKKVFE